MKASLIQTQADAIISVVGALQASVFNQFNLERRFYLCGNPEQIRSVGLSGPMLRKSAPRFHSLLQMRDSQLPMGVGVIAMAETMLRKAASHLPDGASRIANLQMRFQASPG